MHHIYFFVIYVAVVVVVVVVVVDVKFSNFFPANVITTGKPFHNRCKVKITTDGSSAVLSSGCLSTDDTEMPCGSKTQLGRLVTQQCCCDTKMCNDESFIQKCVEDSLLVPPTQPEQVNGTNAIIPDESTDQSSFHCVLSVEADSLTIENGTQNCRGND